MKESRPPGTASGSARINPALDHAETRTEATGGQDGEDTPIRWRYVGTSRLFCGFRPGADKSLCGYHDRGRGEATAHGADIPTEAKCSFCVAVLRSGG